MTTRTLAAIPDEALPAAVEDARVALIRGERGALLRFAEACSERVRRSATVLPLWADLAALPDLDALPCGEGRWPR